MPFPSLTDLFARMVAHGSQVGTAAAAAAPQDAPSIPMSIRVRPHVRAYYEAQGEACGLGSASAMVSAVLEGVMLATSPQAESAVEELKEDQLLSGDEEAGAFRTALGPVDSVLKEHAADAVFIEQPGQYFTRKHGQLQRHEWPALDDQHFRRLMTMASAAVGAPAGRAIARGSIGPGIRLEVLHPPVATNGIGLLAFRIPLREAPSFDELVEDGLFDEVGKRGPRQDLARVTTGIGARLQNAMGRQENILVFGPPLWERIEIIDMLVQQIPADRRVVVIQARQNSDWVSTKCLPPNSIVLTYERGSKGQEFADVARAAEALRPDHVVVPFASAGHKDEFLLGVGVVFKGLIAATDALPTDKEFRNVADVLIEAVSDRIMPHGIGSVAARPLTS